MKQIIYLYENGKIYILRIYLSFQTNDLRRRYILFQIQIIVLIN